MTLGRRPLVVVAALAAAAVAIAVLVALGLDELSLVLGAAVATLATLALVIVVIQPIVVEQRAARRRHRRHVRQSRQARRRTAKDVIRAERRLYWQLEALGWLRDELDLEVPLRRSRGAAAAPDILMELVRLVRERGVTTAVETGSGVSTVVIAAALKRTGGRLVSLEHLRSYREATRRDVADQALEDVATVLDTPLSDVDIDGRTWSWYDISGVDLPDDIELLFVDGPPAQDSRLARYPALPLLRAHLAPGAVIVVDDAARAGEREMVERWQSEVEGLTTTWLDTAKGAYVVTLPD